jgi:hypothetical protein
MMVATVFMYPHENQVLAVGAMDENQEPGYETNREAYSTNGILAPEENLTAASCRWWNILNRWRNQCYAAPIVSGVIDY